MKKLLIFTVLFCSMILGNPATNAHAEELKPNLKLSNGEGSGKLTDTSHYTYVTMKKGDTITVTSADGSDIYGLYISWDSPAVPWTLTTDTGDIACGSNDFIHEYVPLETPSSTLVIHIPQNSMRIDGIRIFGDGELPHDVQVWNPPCERADIMVISSHSDDEILFMGGALPLYAYEYDADIQVVYMCEFRSTGQKVREHEKLDGLWEAGIRFYPVCGNFYDKYCKDFAHAKTLYNYDKMTEYLVKQIRESKPQVIVTHDIFGEYGHGFHILTTQALIAAVDLAAEADKYTDSAETYGVWDTPKTYIHLFNANPITLNLRTPIEEDYAGRTALDILKAAYKKHVSQQSYSFRVDDEYEYSCARYGLYRSLVGEDTTDDFLCNLKTYKVQEAEEAIRLEEERLAAEEAARIAAEEQLAKEEAARIAEEERIMYEEAERIEMAKQEAAIEAHLKEDEKIADELAKSTHLVTVLLVCTIIFFLTTTGLILYSLKTKKSKA